MGFNLELANIQEHEKKKGKKAPWGELKSLQTRPDDSQG